MTTEPLHGSLEGTAGHLEYQPDHDYNGDDSFAFTASDGFTTSQPATVEINVSSVNDPPTVSVPASLTAVEGASVPVIAAVVDVDGDSVTVTWAVEAGDDVDEGASCSIGDLAVTDIVCTDDGTFTLVATANDGVATVASTSTTVTVRNADPVLDSIGVSPPAPPAGTPVAVTAAITDEGANDDHDCSVAWGDGTTSAGTVADRTCSAQHTYSGKGSHAVTVTVTDDDGASTSRTTTVSITNRPPAATPQAVTTDEDTATAIGLTGTDPDGDALGFTIVTPPTHGSLTGSGADWTYTPVPDFNGFDQLTFTTSDGSATSSSATVTISVTPVNDAPTANAAAMTATTATATPLTLTGSDPDGVGLTFEIVRPPSHGTITVFGAVATYTSAVAYTGPDSFEFIARDGGGLQSATVVVPITVVAPPPLLRLSVADDRTRTTQLRPLDGATLRGGASAYIFAGPNGLANVTRVAFTLDGRSFSIDKSAPFDFAGSSLPRRCRTCNPDVLAFESNLLSLGTHRIEATVTFRDGSRTTLVASFTIADTTPHSLAVSASPARTSAAALDGAVLSGRRYLFLGPADDSINGLAAVTFLLDGRRVSVDLAAPYDLIDTRGDGRAAELDTRKLRNGAHTATAIVRLLGGGTVTYEANFRISN